MIPFIRRVFGRAPPLSPWDSPKPVREELFSLERLEEHARSLALAQRVAPKPIKGYSLAGRLADNAAVLLDAYRVNAKAIDEGRTITPAAEWLVDNYHLVEKQIREIRSDLPPGYYRQLPKLIEGPFAGYPRVFGVAWAFVAHSDSRFDPEALCRFVHAYQQTQPLTIGELWAVAITLRIVLVENLRRLAERIVIGRAARQEADGLANRLLGAAALPAESASVVLADYDRSPLPDAFAVQLVHRLRDQDPRVTPALTWLDERLAAQGTTADAVVRDEHQRQGAANVTVRNIITSMRLISDVDWTELFERISLVDAALADGDGLFGYGFLRPAISIAAPSRNWRAAQITPKSRSRAGLSWPQKRRCRRRTMWIAIAERIPATTSLPGDAARSRLAIGYRPPLSAWLGRISQSVGIGGYLSAIGLVAVGLLALPLFVVAASGLSGGWLGLLCVSGSDTRHRCGGRAGEPQRGAELRRDAAALLWSFATVFRLTSARWSRYRPCSRPARRSRNRSSGWRSTTSQAPKAISISRFFPTGGTARPNTWTATRTCWPPPPRASPSSTVATARGRAANAFCCFIGAASGMQERDDGSAGSASAASFMN